MNYTELKTKHGERFLSLISTDIVMEGIKALKKMPKEQSPLAEALRAAFDDINAGSWDEIRAVIKRSL